MDVDCLRPTWAPLTKRERQQRSLCAGAPGLETSLSDVNSTPFGFLGHCVSLACSVRITVTGHPESAALRWNSLTEASLALE